MLRKSLGLTEKGYSDFKKAVIASTAANISLIIPVSFIMYIIIEFLNPLLGKGKNDFNLPLNILISAIFVVIIFIAHYIQYNSTYTASYKESANRRIRLAEKIRELPLSFFSKKDLTELTTNMMTDCTALEQTFSHSAPQLCGAVISLILIGIGLFIYDFRMAAALMITLPISLAMIFGSKKLQESFANKNMDKKLKASDQVQEYLEGIKIIKAYNMGGERFEKLDQSLKSVIMSSIKSELITGGFVSSATIVLKIGIATTVFAGTYLLTKGQIDIVKFILFLLASTRIYEPIAAVFIQIADVFGAKLRIKRMNQLEEESVMEGSKNVQFEGHDIILDNVSFKYNKDEIIHDASFTIKSGEITALVGPSGSGKSTVSRLISRFWDVNTGKILVGGVDIKTVDPETLFSKFSVVFQDVVLFNDTIFNNIKIGKSDASQQEVMEAIKLARCEDFINRLPEKHNTIIGENGSTLSGGERQRLSIARAFLKDAPIILLDEATASLDVENESEIQAAISKLIKNKTVLIIAHRLRTIMSADKIVVLKEGKVVEQGNHEELMKEKGLYSHLVSVQKKGQDWQVNEFT